MNDHDIMADEPGGGAFDEKDDIIGARDDYSDNRKEGDYSRAIDYFIMTKNWDEAMNLSRRTGAGRDRVYRALLEQDDFELINSMMVNDAAIIEKNKSNYSDVAQLIKQALGPEESLKYICLVIKNKSEKAKNMISRLDSIIMELIHE